MLLHADLLEYVHRKVIPLTQDYTMPQHGIMNHIVYQMPSQSSSCRMASRASSSGV